MLPDSINPNLEKDLRSSFALNRDIYFPKAQYGVNYKTKTFDMVDPTKYYEPKVPSALNNEENQSQNQSYPQSYSLYELNSKQKLAKMRQSNKVFAMEEQKDDLDQIQKAIEELGGIADTISTMQDSLIQNEISNIKRTMRQGKCLIYNTTHFIGHSTGPVSFGSVGTLKLDQAPSKMYETRQEPIDSWMSTVFAKSENKRPQMHLVLNKSEQERAKRMDQLYKHQRWSQNNMSNDQKVSNFCVFKSIGINS